MKRSPAALRLPMLFLLAVSIPLGGMAQKDTDIRVNTNPPGAAVCIRPAIAASGEAVYVTWIDDRDGAGDIYFNRSLDGGGSWMSSDVRLDTDAPGAAESSYQSIVAAGDAIYVTWEDKRNGEVDIYFNRSLDKGNTWLSSDVRLDTDAPGASPSESPRIDASAAFVYVIWEDNRDGIGDVYINRSIDGGSSWLSSDLRLDTGLPGMSNSINPQICVSGSSVYAVWMDSRDGTFDIYLNHSQDGGATWLGADIRLDTDLPGVAMSQAPRIAVDSDSVYVLWMDDRNGNVIEGWDIYFNRSLDKGSTWLSSDLRLDTDAAGDSSSYGPQIAASGGSVFAAWTDRRNGGFDNYFNRSLDRGSTWLSSDLKINTNAPNMFLMGVPHIAAEHDSVYLAWTDYRNGGLLRGGDIYFNRSSDGGVSWLSSDIRLDTDSAGAAQSISSGMTLSEAAVYVVWEDERNGTSDIYFNIPFGAQAYGEGTTGSGGHVPKLEGSDALTLGSTFTITISDALGGAAGILALGGHNSKTLEPVNGGSQLVDPVELLAPIVLDGMPGLPGDGTYYLEIFIPVDSVFIGFNVNLQALLVDPSADYGIAWTNAVEAWIL